MYLLGQCVPLMCAFFGHEDDDVSDTVRGFIIAYIQHLKVCGLAHTKATVPRDSNLCLPQPRSRASRNSASVTKCSCFCRHASTRFAPSPFFWVLPPPDLTLIADLQMRYPEDFNFDREGDMEMDFHEYRHQLKTIYENIALLVRACLSPGHQYCDNTTQPELHPIPRRTASLLLSIRWLLLRSFSVHWRVSSPPGWTLS